MDEAEGMRAAIEACREGMRKGQSPFGSAIQHPQHGLVTAHNSVWLDTDPSAHAEVNAIRKTASLHGSIDLGGAVLYSTCEPCPMCLTAIHWAKIDRVVYGADIADAEAAGFSELRISARSMVEQGGSHLIVEGGVMAAECRRLFDEWKAQSLHRSY